MEESKYKQMVEQYSNMIYRIAFSYMKNREDAEDIYQNVFMKLLTKKHFTNAEHEKRWLIRVTINECHSLYRSPWKRQRQECDNLNTLLENQQTEECFVNDQVSSDAIMDVTDMLKSLPEKYSIALYLYYYEDYSTKEIGKILHRNESTIRTHLMRGKEILRKKMEERGMENG